MKVLILGSAGMLGHKLYQVLSPVFDVTGTIRGHYSDVSDYGFFQPSQIVADADARDISRIEQIIEETGPDVVINSIGVVKQLEKERGVFQNIWLNSLFPHQLYQVCQAKGIRLIHVSTDCVFSGRKGNYREDDPSDAEDTYGKTKYLGEVSGVGALTIRTSLIGRELASTNGLIEWFLSNQGEKVNGYTNAIFSGFPTLHLARIIADIIAEHRDLNGIYHISSEPISKFQLLTLIKKAMKLNIKIGEYPDYHCNRSLDSTKYREETGFTPPSWEKMVEELTQDAVQYQKWR
ncbi:dTDP-4-dehydrorhamnose reductase family protein [Chloroflexota bacterium]